MSGCDALFCTIFVFLRISRRSGVADIGYFCINPKYLTFMQRLILLPLLAFLLLTSCCGDSSSTTAPTYCNPMDLTYGWGAFRQTLARAAADPVVVLFKDRYYLFSTHDTGGYRVSDDLVHWEDIAFDPAICYAAQDNGRYVAPAVATDGNYIYFIRLKRDRKATTTEVIRTDDPDSGRWEHVADVRRVSDPTLFINEGRFFIFHGLGINQAIRCFEVDPETFAEIPDSERILHAFPNNIDEYEAGYHLGRREIYDEIDARDWKGRFRWLPSPEGAWVVRHDNKYYLQFATPGTICIWYADVLMVADRPEGPYEVVPYNPVSLKAGGFIGGAGHSSVFQDRYGNWWEITSMWVGNRDPFERRLGLFPVSFDEQGRMQVHTRFGDYPMQVPQRKFNPATEASMQWNLLSYNRACRASSSLDGHGPQLAADENVRTWWSASTGNADEWFEMDLGREMRIEAVQLNFAEEQVDTTRLDRDYTAYRLLLSQDGERWEVVADEHKNRRTNPHHFLDLKQPVLARYARVECVEAMLNGKFALRDVRLFGHGLRQAPAQVTHTHAVRDAANERFAHIAWSKVADAEGYLVCFGATPDHLNLTVQVKGYEQHDLQVHILTKGVPYYYRVDSYNDSGVTLGEVVAEEHAAH